MPAPALTEKDRRDLGFGLALGVDYVALSFVRAARGRRSRRERLLHRRQVVDPVIAKIEKPEAVEQSRRDHRRGRRRDGRARRSRRGDGPEKVPLVQKQIIDAANARGKS